MNTNPSKQETDFIRQSLADFNEDADGNIVGGILGGTYWGWMYIDILWVREDCRRQGIGSKLLAEAEKEAVRRGCHHIHVDTMSWQAPNFYKKHGYETIVFSPTFPKEIKSICL